jgi:hypothetical protein
MTTKARSKAAAAMGRAKSPHKAVTSRINALKGVAVRMAFTPEKRREQAMKASAARWAKYYAKVTRKAAATQTALTAQEAPPPNAGARPVALPRLPPRSR